MRKAILYTCALFAFASCADNTYMGEKEEETKSGGAISFGGNLPSVTRSTTEEVTKLNGNFVVFGYKTQSTTKQTVFDNYQVNYKASSANSTPSNSASWEYVGYKNLPNGVGTNVGVIAYATLDANSSAIEQSIKYWDFTTGTTYDFFAYSLGNGTGATPTYAKSSKMVHSDSPGYSLTGSKEELGACYISKKKQITPTSSSATEVDLEFLSFFSKIQLGFFETIPGYSIKNIKFYSADNQVTSSATPYLYAGSASIANGGTYNITFDTDGNPIITFSTTSSPTYASNIEFSSTLSSYASAEKNEGVISGGDYGYLGRTSNTATKTDQVNVLPMSTGVALTIKMDYTLVSTDGSGEVINITGGAATIPAAYTTWKPNYAYTYLFKITDDKLKPITLDATIVTLTDGTQETITTVTETSITTYAKASAVTTNNEYVTGNKIYAVVEDASASPTNPTLTVGTNAKLYFVTLESGAAQTITEASVANAIAHGTHVELDKTYTVTDASNKKMIVTDTESNLLKAITTIPSSDSPTGVEITVNGAEFTPQAKYVQVTSGTTLTTGVTYYSSASGGTEFTGTEATGETYRKVSEATGAYVFAYKKSDDTWYYKVIKVVANS